MIDTKNEQLFALKYARRWFPRRRRGKRPALPTLYRYSNEGYQGVILETVQVGGTRCTSREAVARFIEGISNPQLREVPILVRPKATDQIDKALQDAGFDRRPTEPHTKLGRPGTKRNCEQVSGFGDSDDRNPNLQQLKGRK